MFESRQSRLTPSGWRYRNDNRPYARLYYVKEGEGYFRTNGEEHELRPGGAYLIPPRGDADYGCSSNMEIWWIHFSASLFGCIDLFDALPGSVARIPEDLPTLEERMQRLLLLRRESFPAAQIECTGILLTLIAPFFGKAGSVPAAGLDDEKRIFLPVLRHIEGHLSDPISVADLAGIVHYEKSHFSVLFTRAFGLSPMQFVIRRRIEKVQLFLHRSEARLEELAERFGFHDAFHLSRTFKRVTGVSPRDYRRASRDLQP
jgi:AraC-like DNA-binding protein